MRSVADIKALEIKTQREYIRGLYESLPDDPITGFEFELERAIKWDIERAEKELAEL